MFQILCFNLDKSIPFVCICMTEEKAQQTVYLLNKESKYFHYNYKKVA